MTPELYQKKIIINTFLPPITINTFFSKGIEVLVIETITN